jgi:hypothetical protein
MLAEPNTVQLVMVLFVASAMNFMVDVPEEDDTCVFEIVRELPSVFKPLTVTLSAPLKLISGVPAVGAPEMVLAPLGLMVILVQAPAFKLLVPASVKTSELIVITIFAPVCAVPLIAANAPEALVKEV